MAQPENKAFTESYLDCSSAWLLFRTPYWVGDALNGLAKIQLSEAEKGLIKVRLLALTEDIEIVAEGLKSRILQRISFEEANSFIYTFTDTQLKELLLHSNSLGVELLETENIIFNASRISKQFSVLEVKEQIGWWKVVKDRGYPYLFTSEEAFNKLGKLISELAEQWNIPSNSIYVQGSTLRINSVGELIGGKIGDIDISIKVNASTFESLMDRFKNLSDNPNTIARIGRNGKIGGVDMKKGIGIEGSIMGDFYPKFTAEYGMTFQKKFGVPKIQISIIKEGGTLDVSPFLKFK